MNKNNKNRNRWVMICNLSPMSDYPRLKFRENRKNVFNSSRTVRRALNCLNDDLN